MQDLAYRITTDLQRSSTLLALLSALGPLLPAFSCSARFPLSCLIRRTLSGSVFYSADSSKPERMSGIDSKADNYCLPNFHPTILTPFCLCSLAKPLQPDNAISYFLRATEEGNFIS